MQSDHGRSGYVGQQHQGCIDVTDSTPTTSPSGHRRKCPLPFPPGGRKSTPDRPGLLAQGLFVQSSRAYRSPEGHPSLVTQSRRAATHVRGMSIELQSLIGGKTDLMYDIIEYRQHVAHVVDIEHRIQHLPLGPVMITYTRLSKARGSRQIRFAHPMSITNRGQTEEGWTSSGYRYQLRDRNKFGAHFMNILLFS